MEEKLNSDTERTSVPYPEYIVIMAVVINQYARGEISVYECFAFIEDKPTQIIQHSEENDRKAREYLLQRHPDPEWWKNR